jgi:hypothetical protein
MINFYDTRHMKSQLAEFLSNFSDPNMFSDKYSLLVLSNGFYSCNRFDISVLFLNHILNKIDPRCKETQIKLIKSISNIDSIKSDEIRSRLDQTKVDLSQENITSLLSEVVLKMKRNVIKSTKKKKKRKIRYPKNFNPEKPGPMPDLERWVPQLQRKKNRGLNKNKKAYQGGEIITSSTTQTSTTGATVTTFK